MIKISPSILSADFVNLERDIARVSSADMLHVDVMDGCFVPNLTIGVPVVQSIRKCTDLFLDVHLMIDKPVRYVEAFAQAGADLLSVHLEADHPTRIAQALKVMGECGVKKAVALRPITKAEAVLPYLEELDLVLVMTVEPGFGGQAFLEEQLETVSQVRALIDRYHPACRLEVDGGVNAKTAPRVVAAGADTLVAGSAVYGAADVIVTDGYSGNIFLKTMEGTGGFLARQLKAMFRKSLLTKLAALMVSGGLKQFKKLMDDTIAQVQTSGEAEKWFDKWFKNPIPPKNLNMNFELSDEMKALFKEPNDKALN